MARTGDLRSLVAALCRDDNVVVICHLKCLGLSLRITRLLSRITRLSSRTTWLLSRTTRLLSRTTRLSSRTHVRDLSGQPEIPYRFMPSG